MPLAPGCDTINFPVPPSWGRQNYQLTSGNTGYLTGTSTFTNREYAHFFDLGVASPNQYLTRCYINFAIAASGNPANLGKAITIRVYDGTSNLPGGAVLGTTTTTLGDIRIDYLLNDKTDITFPSPILLPASKKFFIGVDISTLTWPTDSLSIFSSTAGTTPSRTWARNPDADPQWYDLFSEFGLRLSLYIHPFVSPTTTCQVTTPVSLLRFAGKAVADGHLLTWTTASESSNKGFYVEHSPDGKLFQRVGFVPAKGNGNSQQEQQYSYTHQPASPATEHYYRLKQVDKDGSSSYSQQVLIRQATGGLITAWGRLFPNPAQGRLVLEWKQPPAQGSQLRLLDAQGRVWRSQALAAGAAQTIVDIKGMNTGLYILQLTDAKNKSIASEKFWVEQ